MHDQPGGQELPRRDPRCTQRFLDNLSCVQALWAPVGTTPCLGLSRVLRAVSGVRPGREGAREAQMSGWATYSGYQRTWAGGSELWALGKLGSGAGHPLCPQLMFQATIGLNFLKSFGAGPHPPLSCLLWPSSCTSAQGIPGDPGRRDHSAGPQTPGAAGPAHLPESELNTGNQNCCGNACPLFWSPRPPCSSSRHYISESFPSDAHDCCTSESKLYTAQYLFLKLCLRFMLTKICGLGVEKVPSTKGKFSYF